MGSSALRDLVTPIESNKSRTPKQPALAREEREKGVSGRDAPPLSWSLSDLLIVRIVGPGLEEHQLTVDRIGEELDRHM